MHVRGARFQRARFRQVHPGCLPIPAALARYEYIVPGDPDASYLLDVVTPETAGTRPQMPKEGDPLSVEQIATLRAWIAAGAPWPEDAKIQQRAAADTSL